jgi:hypothetical protein
MEELEASSHVEEQLKEMRAKLDGMMEALNEKKKNNDSCGRAFPLVKLQVHPSDNGTSPSQKFKMSQLEIFDGTQDPLDQPKLTRPSCTSNSSLMRSYTSPSQR